MITVKQLLEEQTLLNTVEEQEKRIEQELTRKIDLTKNLLCLNGIRYFDTGFKIKDSDFNGIKYLKVNNIWILTLEGVNVFKEQIFIPNQNNTEYSIYLNIKHYYRFNKDMKELQEKEEKYRKNYLISNYPNIYLYYEGELNVNLELDGFVCKSNPVYGNGWNVSVSNNKINNEHDYLFYETITFNHINLNKEFGWIIRKDNYKEYLTQILTQYNFNTKEIEDFIRDWSNVMYKDYYVYPITNEDVDNIVKIKIDVELNQYRLWLVFEPVENDMKELIEPTIIPFTREGNHLVEWGGFII